MMFIFLNLHEFGHPCNPDQATVLSRSENIQKIMRRKNISHLVHQDQGRKSLEPEYFPAYSNASGDDINIELTNIPINDKT